MFNTQEYIVETRAEIARIKRSARWAQIASVVILITGLVLFLCAGIQLLLIHLYAFRMQGQIQHKIGEAAENIWKWFATTFPTLWSFVAALPFPKAMPQENYYLPWVFFAVFYICFVLAAAALKKRAVRLRVAAKEAEQTLSLQAPLLMQMSAFASAYGSAQSANVGNVSGAGNTVNVTNTINHALDKAGEKKLSDKFWIPLAIAAATALLNHSLK